MENNLLRNNASLLWALDRNAKLNVSAFLFLELSAKVQVPVTSLDAKLHRDFEGNRSKCYL